MKLSGSDSKLQLYKDITNYSPIYKIWS